MTASGPPRGQGGALGWWVSFRAAGGSVSERPEQVVSLALKTELEDYLAFRHFSRNATFVVLDWERMRPLVDGLDDVVQRFRSEIEAFLGR
jgi:hypothetical protein